MDISMTLDPLLQGVGDYLPRLAVVVVAVVGGWILALGARAFVRKGTSRLGVNERFQREGAAFDIERSLSTGTYYAVLLVTLIAAINALNLPLATEPLRAMLNPLFGFLPNLIGAVLLGLTAWIAASVARKLASVSLRATQLDERLSEAAGVENASEAMASALYYLVLLLFLPGILGVLGLGGLLTPFVAMVTALLGFLPNLLGAAVLGAIGWIVASLLGNLTVSVLQATRIDASAERLNVEGFVPSKATGVAVRVVVFVPALIAALDALKLEAISGPATAMLHSLLAAIPYVLAAALILGIAWVVARIVAPLVVSFLSGMGADSLPEKLGLHALFGDSKPSELAGKLTVLGILLFAATEAAARLGFESIASWVGQFIEFAGQVMLGGVIIVIGLALANWAAGAIERATGQQGWFPVQVARVAIIGFVLAMGLNAMGVADSVVNIAFGLTLGSVALAVGLAFGLGGREAASRIAERMSERYLEVDVSPEQKSAAK